MLRNISSIKFTAERGKRLFIRNFRR